MKKLSVVIPTYNRLESLKRILGGFENQTFSHTEFEVLVISDGSTDGTEDYLRTVKTAFSMRSIFQGNQGPAAARNHGILEAEGDLILFIDDDVLPLPELIDEHMNSHKQYGDYAVVIGPMLAPPDCRQSPWERWEAKRLAEQYQDMEVGKWAPTARQFYTGNSSIARHHLLKSGGFDPAFRRAEDVELAYRLVQHGLKFYYNPRAAGYHYAVRSLASWLAIPQEYGHNDVIFSQKRGQTWLMSTVHKEFHTRHPLTRAITLLCINRPGITAVITASMICMMQTSHILKIKKFTDILCSAIFNLRYYQGMTDEMEGQKVFIRG